jgi:hypothetical protein
MRVPQFDAGTALAGQPGLVFELETVINPEYPSRFVRGQPDNEKGPANRRGPHTLITCTTDKMGKHRRFEPFSCQKTPVEIEPAMQVNFSLHN